MSEVLNNIMDFSRRQNDLDVRVVRMEGKVDAIIDKQLDTGLKVDKAIESMEGIRLLIVGDGGLTVQKSLHDRIRDLEAAKNSNKESALAEVPVKTAYIARRGQVIVAALALSGTLLTGLVAGGWKACGALATIGQEALAASSERETSFDAPTARPPEPRVLVSAPTPPNALPPEAQIP